MTAVLWLRRDLRVNDHPSLRAALAAHERVIPLFCFDPRLLRGRHGSRPRTQFLLECLNDLHDSLRQRGSGLVVREGRPEKIMPQLVDDLGAQAVFWTEDISPFAVHRDQAVRQALQALSVEAHVLPGLFAAEDVLALRTSAGDPYRVFAPFHRAWLNAARREVLPAPRRLPPLPRRLDLGRLPTLQALAVEPAVGAPQGGSPARLARGGERAGRRAMLRFLSEHAAHYGSDRHNLGRARTSRLSPYLHFGCISARELEQRLDTGRGPSAFQRQLCWRDFYGYLLAHFPENARLEFRERFRGGIRWSADTDAFAAWREGRTGYPLVDAAMRQLGREGWMPNRARLVVGSFLTKDLGLDWRWGEQWFMRLLIDGDEANNNGNWQWIASVGVDPQPPFRRIYNPTRQQQQFDSDGAYVRRHLRELRKVPAAYLAEPWTMPPEVQQQARCVIGADYPAPIVDHLAARRAALARYG
jgi:deoxyribodipyrimidine photo-lyase